MDFKCNIDKTDRNNRIVIGIILILAGLLDFGALFYVIVGIVLVVEGYVGWCGIPMAIQKVKDFMKSKK